MAHPKAFSHVHRVGFWETDAMGVVHHSNYLKYFEEARVSWMRAQHLIDCHYPNADLALGVIESRVSHLKPARFNDELRIFLQVKQERLKIHFQYAIYLNASDALVASGSTVLVPVNSSLRPVRVPEPLVAQLEKETWTETWP